MFSHTTYVTCCVTGLLGESLVSDPSSHPFPLKSVYTNAVAVVGQSLPVKVSNFQPPSIPDVPHQKTLFGKDVHKDMNTQQCSLLSYVKEIGKYEKQPLSLIQI